MQNICGNFSSLHQLVVAFSSDVLLPSLFLTAKLNSCLWRIDRDSHGKGGKVATDDGQVILFYHVRGHSNHALYLAIRRGKYHVPLISQ